MVLQSGVSDNTLISSVGLYGSYGVGDWEGDWGFSLGTDWI